MRIWKMNGAGNAFAVFDAREGKFAPSEAQLREIATSMIADQIMAIEPKGDKPYTWFDKPADHGVLRDQLMAISGQTHVLETAAVLLYRGARIWHQLARPKLTVRPLAAEFIDQYVASAGDELLSCVGGYQIEALGPHLFHRIEGDEFSIRGLPLLPLLGFLRERKVILG